MTWTALSELMAQRWGDFASLLGLIVSVLTLSVATKAREAGARTGYSAIERRAWRGAPER